MKKVLILTTLIVALNGNSFSKYYNQGNKNFDKHKIEKAYLNYTKAYNFAKTKREKIKALGALAVVSKEQGFNKLAKEYANKILKLDPNNRFAKKFLANSSSSSNSLTKKEVLALICKKPHKNSCKCKDVKVFSSPNFFAADSLSVEDVIRGDFVEKNEALANLYGCQPHAANWGGYLLLRKYNKKWKSIKYGTPILGSKCEKIRLKKNKDALICEDSYTNQGYTENSLYLSYFDKNARLKNRLIYRGESNAGAVGSDSPSYKDSTIKSWRVIKKGAKYYVILKVYNENKAKGKKGIRVIRKEIK